MRYVLIFTILISHTAVSAQDVPVEFVHKMDSLKRLEVHYWKNKEWEKHMRVCHNFLVNYEEYLPQQDKAIWNVKIA